MIKKKKSDSYTLFCTLFVGCLSTAVAWCVITTNVINMSSLFFSVLCRNGSPEVQRCSTWSAACVWIASLLQARRSSHSAAPRWPANPGSRSWSPDSESWQGRRGKGRSLVRLLSSRCCRSQRKTFAHCFSWRRCSQTNQTWPCPKHLTSYPYRGIAGEGEATFCLPNQSLNMFSDKLTRHGFVSWQECCVECCVKDSKKKQICI